MDCSCGSVAMLNEEEIQKLVIKAYSDLSFISYDEKDINFTYYKLGGLSGENEAIKAVKNNDQKKMNFMLSRIENIIKAYDTETPIFIEHMENYKKIFDNPGSYKYVALKNPDDLISRRNQNLNRLKEINRMYIYHQYTTEKQNFNDLIYNPDSALDEIISCTNTLLKHMEKIKNFRENEIFTVHPESISDLETEWFRIGYALAEKGLFDLAVECWLKIPEESNLYTKAHFEAFECVYHAKLDLKSSPFSAFIDALPACYSEQEFLITFTENEQRVFDSCLLTAVGIEANIEIVNTLDKKTSALLLKYVLLKAASEDIKINSEFHFKQIKTFFAEERVQGLVARLNKLLPALPLSFQTLQSLEELINGVNGKKGLWEKSRPGINAALFSNESLKFMLKGIYKQETLEQELEQLNKSKFSGQG